MGWGLRIGLSDEGLRRCQTMSIYPNQRLSSMFYPRRGPRSLKPIFRSRPYAQPSQGLARLSINSEFHTKPRRSRRLERPARLHRGDNAPLPKGMTV